MLRCVIIDDEEFSIDALKIYINQLPQLKIVGTYTEPQAALQELLFGEYLDILFLDVDMPQVSGIELAQILRLKTDKLVFTTSHSKYAFDAFEVQADAFLLKPFSFSKFSTAIGRLFPEKQRPASEHEYFLVKNKEEDLRVVKIKFAEVVAFESLHNYVKIHLVNAQSITAYLSIKDVLDLVDGRRCFRQFHRAFVISTDQISYIEGSSIKMSNNITFNAGERFKEHFAAYLSNNLVTTSRKK